MSVSAWMSEDRAALFTDQYQLTMLQAYLRNGMTANAVFSLFVRTLPPHRNYLVACGLEDCLRYLETLRFHDDHLRYLQSLGKFDDAFLDYLRGFRFTGDVYAAPEGTPVFANEPILEVSAPAPQAQLLETFLINQIQLQTLAASKAARVLTAAAGRTVVDFGMRRTHGADAALKAARAFHIAGLHATSNVLAGYVYGVPISGTMAHSYIQAHDRETDAFRSFAAVYPDTILLVDTYDTLEGVRNVIRLAEDLGDEFRVSGIRLDSGDLATLAKESRALLDAAGLARVKIIASGGLDEYEIAALIAGGAPIDGFGVGTHMGVSKDAPALDIVYKLAAYGGEGRMKLSTQKATLPGRKQVFRVHANGRMARDVIALAEEALEGEPLLEQVMRSGTRLAAGRRPLDDIRRHAARERSRLPTRLLALDPAEPPYSVEISEGLRAVSARTREEVAARATASRPT